MYAALVEEYSCTRACRWRTSTCVSLKVPFTDLCIYSTVPVFLYVSCDSQTIRCSINLADINKALA